MLFEVYSLQILAAKACLEAKVPIADQIISDAVEDDLDEAQVVVQRSSIYDRIAIIESDPKTLAAFKTNDASTFLAKRVSLCLRSMHRYALIATRRKDREKEAFAGIARLFQACPFLVLAPIHPLIATMEDKTKLPLLVQLACKLQDAVSESDNKRVFKDIVKAIIACDSASGQLSNPDSIGSGLDKVELPTAYWFSMFACLDCQQWLAAMVCLNQIMAGFIMQVWPFELYHEVLYYFALIEFGLEYKPSCKRLAKSYLMGTNYIHRHAVPMYSLLQWANDDCSPKLMENKYVCHVVLCQVLWGMQSSWNLYASNTWITDQVAMRRGEKPMPIHKLLRECVESEEGQSFLNKTGEWLIDSAGECIDHFEKFSQPQFITVRYRNIQGDADEEDQDQT